MSGEDPSVAARPPASPDRRRTLVLAAVCVLGAALWTWALIAVLHRFPLYPKFEPLSDLGEHLRDAGIVVHGGDPYVLRPTLNDTTPPFTVLVYAPLRLLHGAVLETVVVLANLIALAVALAAATTRIIRRSFLECLALAIAVLAPLTILVLSQAVWSSLWWGQDQTIMMSLVVIDLLLVPARWRGLLIGVAAGVLLSPVVFVVLVARVGWGAVARVAGALAGTVVVAGVINLHATTTYWFHLLPSGEAVRRVFILGGHGTGTVGTPANLSLEGMLARRPFAHHVPLTATWLIMAAVLGVLTVAVAWVAQGRKLDVTAMVLIGLASAALSPVGWDHHWVWAALLPFAAVEVWGASRLLSVALALAVPVAFIRSYPLTRVVHWPGTLDGVLWSSGPPLVFIVLVALAAWVVLRPSPIAAVRSSGWIGSSS